MSACGCHVRAKAGVQDWSQGAIHDLVEIDPCARHSEAHVVALEARVMDLETQLTHQKEMDDAASTVSEARLTRMREALRTYGRHKETYVVDGASMRSVPDCGWYKGEACDCGLLTALED